MEASDGKEKDDDDDENGKEDGSNTSSLKSVKLKYTGCEGCLRSNVSSKNGSKTLCTGCGQPAE